MARNAPGLEDVDCKCLDNVLQRTPELLPVLKEALACGLPFDDLIAQLERDMDVCQKLKARLFPHLP